MLNINVQKIKETRLAALAETKEIDVATQVVEQYFNDPANLLAEVLAVNVNLSPNNVVKFTSIVEQVGLAIQAVNTPNTFVVFLPDEAVVQPVEDSVVEVAPVPLPTPAPAVKPVTSPRHEFKPPTDLLFGAPPF